MTLLCQFDRCSAALREYGPITRAARILIVGALSLAVSTHWTAVTCAQTATPEPTVAEDYHTLYYSAHLPSDRRQTQSLEQTRALIDDERFSEAFPLLSRILCANDDAFEASAAASDPSVASLKTEAEATLATLPPEGRAEWELQQGVAARRDLRDALTKGDIEVVLSIYRRYPNTDAAAEAASIVASRYLATGDVACAARLLSEVAKWPTNDRSLTGARWLAAASASSVAGDVPQLDRALSELTRLGPATLANLRWAGQPIVNWAALTQQLRAHARAIDQSSGPSEDWLEPAAWRHEGGSDGRSIAVPGGGPHVWPVWQARTAKDAADIVTLRARRDELLRKQRAWMIATSPVAVGDVVVARTPQQLVAFNWTTGKRVWETRPEMVPAGTSPLSLVDQTDSDSPALISLGTAEQRTWLDVVYGSISTDGRRVFAIRDLNAVGGNLNQSQWGMIRVFSNGEEDTSTLTNSLVAYDLQSEGKLLWQIDGAESAGALRGVAFLGAPLATPQGLVALAEVGNAVQLVLIESTTGQVAWQQPLVNLERGIAIDVGRRLTGTSPSYAAGIAICPTGAGSVVAVDVLARKLLWAFRFPVTEEMASREANNWNRGFGAYQPTLAEQWARSRCLIVGEKVLVTSPESDDLYCIDVATGKLLWSKPRGEALYVAGVHQQQVLAIGAASVEAIHLESGDLAWAHDELPGGGLIGGFGLLSEGQLLLPLIDGRLIALDAATGELQGSVTARDCQALGNLIYHRGAIISQSAETMERFDQASAVQELIAQRSAASPADPLALRLSAEIALASGETGQAITMLRQAYANDPDDILVQSRLTAALVEGLTANYVAYRELAPLLDELVPPGAQRVELLRTHVEGCRAAGEIDTALDYAWQLFMNENDRLITLSLDHMLLSERWYNARVRELLEQATPAAREQFDKRLHDWLATIPQESRFDTLSRTYRYLNGCPVMQDAAVEFASMLMSAGRVREAELVLLALEPQGPVATDQNRLADIWGQLLQPMTAAGQAPPIAWPRGKVVVNTQRISAGSSSNSRGTDMPQRTVLRSTVATFRQLGPVQLAIDGVGNELLGWNPRGEVVFRRDVELQDNSGVQESAACFRFGHFCFFNSGNEIVGVDLRSDPRGGQDSLLWQSHAGRRANFNAFIVQQRMMFDDGGGLTEPAGDTRYGEVRSASPLGVVVQNADRLICFDPLSGDILWRRLDVPMGGLTFADEQHLYLSAEEADTGSVYRIVDGAEVGTWNVPAGEVLARCGATVVTARLQAGRRQLELRDIGTDDVLDRRSYTSAAKFLPVGTRLIAIEPAGKCEVLDLSQQRLLWQTDLLSEPGLDSFEVLATERALFLVTNTRTAAQHRAAGLRPLDNGPIVKGHLYALDWETGRPRWPHPATVSGVGLLELQPLDAPALVLAGQVDTRDSGGEQTTRLVCVDRITGRSLHRADGLRPLQEGVLVVRIDGGERPTVSVNLDHTLVQLEYTDEPFAPEPVMLTEVEVAASERSTGFMESLGRILSGSLGESPPSEADDD